MTIRAKISPNGSATMMRMASANQDVYKRQAQQTELDYLIYNDPLGYADLILNGDPKEYLKNVSGSRTLED